MSSFHNGPLRNVSNQKNFRSIPNNESCHSQQSNLVDDLRQREKVYLDVIVDLTNRNRQLQQQNKMYAQHCEMLEEELRRRADTHSQNRHARSSSSQKNLFRGFGKVQQEPERPQIDVLRKEIEQVDELPELANNSSRFVERMALMLDSNFGDEINNRQKVDLPEIPSCTKTDSLKSQESISDTKADSIKIVKSETPIDFSSKNTQIRNIYTVPKDGKEQPTLSAFSKTSYRPVQITPSFPNNTTSRMVKQTVDPNNRQSNLNNFHRVYTEDRQNNCGTRQNIHSIFAQQQQQLQQQQQSNINIKPAFTSTLRSNSNNRSLHHKEYLKVSADGSHSLASNTFNTSSHSSLATYHNSINTNSNSQLRLGSHH